MSAADTRYVYSAGCTWHDLIEKIATNRVGLPCCPHCGSMLFECETAELFWSQTRSYEAKEPGYEAMIRWSQGKCFPDFDTLQNAYRQAMEE